MMSGKTYKITGINPKWCTSLSVLWIILEAIGEGLKFPIYAHGLSYDKIASSLPNVQLPNGGQINLQYLQYEELD